MAQIKIPKEKVAIVLIEPQNDFLSEGGTMYAHIKEQLAERHVIANLQDLLEKARSASALWRWITCEMPPNGIKARLSGLSV